MKRTASAGIGYNLLSGKPVLTMHIDDASLKSWNRQVFSMIEAAGEGAEELVRNMNEAILMQSRKYVPTDTFTLYNSAYTKLDKKRATFEVQRIGGEKGYNYFVGTVGYGDNEQAGGPNPRTGIEASKYAWKVHEDIMAKHPNGGQAKFLERAYREYVASEFGPEMVQLEKCIYLSKKYAPVIRYGHNTKQFTGKWERKRRNERTRDNVTNLDRLSDLYSNTTRKGSN